MLSRGRAGGNQEAYGGRGIQHLHGTYMGGVDKSDQLLSYYGFSHRMVKWWKRAAFHSLDMAVVNAYIVYKTFAHLKKLTHEQFRIELAKEMLL